MRRGHAGIVLLLAIWMTQFLIGAPVWAADEYGPAERQCTITDPEINELSGLAALPSGELLIVEDSTPEPRPGSTSILMYRLDALCAVQGEIAEFDQDPRDVEDLALLDNTLWFASRRQQCVPAERRPDHGRLRPN